jgi:hypothetical protein
MSPFAPDPDQQGRDMVKVTRSALDCQWPASSRLLHVGRHAHRDRPKLVVRHREQFAKRDPRVTRRSLLSSRIGAE